MNIYTITASCPFLETLAKKLLNEYHADLSQLTKVEIFLPTNRSCRELTHIFSFHQPFGKKFLPILSTICESVSDELTPQIAIHNQLKPISHLAQKILMTKILREREECQSLPLSAVTNLADSLLKFVAELVKEQVDLSKVSSIFLGDAAGHLQNMLQLLKFATLDWPRILSKMGYIDQIVALSISQYARIEKLLESNHRVIAAGILPSSLLTKKLLKNIFSLQSGSIILAGLDQESDDFFWQNVNEVHPQFHYKQLFEFLNITHHDVKIYGETKKTNHAREQFTSNILTPSGTKINWIKLAEISPHAIKGLKIVTANNLQQEANIICLMLRQIAEDNGKTAALITNERELAERVITGLTKWGININDSTGNYLNNSKIAIYLRLIIQMIRDNYSPASLLAVLKNPLTRLGYSQTEYLLLIEALELKLLRGIRFYHNLSDLKTDQQDLQDLLDKLQILVQPLEKQYFRSLANFNELLLANLTLAEQLANTDEEDGKLRLWADEEAEHLAKFLEQLQILTENTLRLNPNQYLILLEHFLIGEKYRSAKDLHPRITILSPKEARLLHFDLVILGGLNENSWPEAPGYDPYLSIAIRNYLNMPVNAEIAESAHCFYSEFHRQEVVITRSLKLSGSPTKKSRWLLRLEVVLTKLSLWTEVQANSPWQEWAEDIYLGPDLAFKETEAPTPKPNVKYRPKRLSITQIESLMRNPYAIYASEILGLKKLEPLDKSPGPAEFGNFIHKAIELFTKKQSDKHLTQSEYLPVLLNCGNLALKSMIALPIIKRIWWPRFELIAHFLVDYFSNIAKDAKILAEKRAKIEIETSNGLFTLVAKADRLEIQQQHCTIIDFKTGQLPKSHDILKGMSPQLTLEALMVKRSGFIDLKPAEVLDFNLQYFHLSGGETAGNIYPVKADLDILIAQAEDGLKNLLNSFTNIEMPYLYCPNPEYAPKYNDYQHLARVKEWLF